MGKCNVKYRVIEYYVVTIIEIVSDLTVQVLHSFEYSYDSVFYGNRMSELFGGCLIKWF